MDPETWVATYAAIVATGALFLEVRRWFESGPRVVVQPRPNMMLIGTDGDDDEEGILIVNVYNRGDASTTITGLSLYEFPSWWARYRFKASRAFFIPNPQPAGSLPIVPKELRPGGHWVGLARPRPELTGDIETGRFCAAIHCTDRDKPYLARIPKRKPESKADKGKPI
jgi:hypothetical protein